MNAERILEDHVVVVVDGWISTVGATESTEIPPDARAIDCDGGYLMPGLADMHTHLHRRDHDPAHLVLYLAEGVTTVRSMSGPPENHEWRLAVERGELVGPTILTAGNVIIDGLEGVDPERIAAEPVFIPSSSIEAVEEVQRQASDFPDFVKVYDGLEVDHYLAAIGAAKKAGLYVAGHVLDEVDLETVLTSGIDEIAHVDELNHSHWVGTPDRPDFRFDRAAIATTARLMKENDVAIVSNLVADEVMYQLIFDAAGVFSRPDYRVVRPALLERWKRDGRQTGKYSNQGPYRRDLEMPFFKELIGALHAAGVLITVGTDTSPELEGSLPAGIHRDLELLVESGLSIFDALSAGTRTAARVVERMGRDGRFGTIEPGQRADLLLLAENPLESVSRTRNRRGVMARGRWTSQRDLDLLVDELVTSY